MTLPLLILFIAALGIFLALRSGGEGTTTVVVQPANADPASRAAAQELSVKLGSMESAIAGSFRLTTPAAGEIRKSDLVLQVSGSSGSASLSRDLTVMSGRTGAILWAGHLEQPRENAGDLPVQLGVTAARVLSCALDALSERKPELRHDTIKLYLTGCSQAAEEYDETSSNVALLFEKVVHQAPQFAAAWAKLLYSEAIGVDAEPDSPIAPKLRAHLEQANRHGIETSSNYLAKAALLPSNSFFQRLDTIERGLRRYPDDANLEAALGDWMMRVGRQNDAVEHARRASELDPLSPALRMRYIWTLAHSGKAEVLHELRKADLMWPGATNIELARFSFALRYGDPREALRMIEQGSLRRGQESLVTFLQARISPTKANVDRAVAAEVQLHRQTPVYISGLVTTLATFGRNDEAVQALLGYQHPEAAGYNSEGWFRAPMRGMRRDPRFMEAMARVGLASYWKRSGEWPDFCFEPDLPYDCKIEAAKYHE